jgi:hypothetical protein
MKGRKYWGWNLFDGDFHPEWSKDYNFSGIINIPDLELEYNANKYNI